jgi:P-type Cu2+ transporter
MDKPAHVRHEDPGDPHAAHAAHGVSGGASGRAAHDRHAGHSPEMFRDRFWLSLALTVPVVVWSEHIEMLLGYRAPVFPGSAWIPGARHRRLRVRRARVLAWRLA